MLPGKPQEETVKFERDYPSEYKEPEPSTSTVSMLNNLSVLEDSVKPFWLLGQLLQYCKGMIK